MFTMGPPIWSGSGSSLADVALQCRFEGADGGTTFVNDAPGGATLTGLTGAVTSVAQKKFGSSCLKLAAASGTGLQSTNSPTLYVRNNSPYTIELFVYFTSLSGFQYILELVCDSGYRSLLAINSGGTTCFWKFTSSLPDNSVAHSFAINTWYHLAIVNEPGVNSKLYIDGVLKQTAANSAAGGSVTNSRLYVGNDSGLFADYVRGYIDSVRLSRLVQYTGAFTPPAADFPSS